MKSSRDFQSEDFDKAMLAIGRAIKKHFKINFVAQDLIIDTSPHYIQFKISGFVKIKRESK